MRIRRDLGCGRRKGLCASWREEADKCIIGKAGGGVAALGSNTEGRQREGCFVVGRKWKEEVLMRKNYVPLCKADVLFKRRQYVLGVFQLCNKKSQCFREIIFICPCKC